MSDTCVTLVPVTPMVPSSYFLATEFEPEKVLLIFVGAFSHLDLRRPYSMAALIFFCLVTDDLTFDTFLEMLSAIKKRGRMCTSFIPVSIWSEIVHCTCFL